MRFSGVFLPALLFACGCATPVGVASLGRNYAYEQIDRCALNARTFSSYTMNVLHRYDLDELYNKSPAQCLVALHDKACEDSRRDTLFALAEISYLQGKQGRRLTILNRRLKARNFFAASAAYAYLYLTGLEADPEFTPFDRRYRIASDLYNRSLGYSVALRDAPVPGAESVIELPVGSIRIRSGHSDFAKPLSAYQTVVSADRYKIHGLSVRNRTAGMGSPIILVDKNEARSPVPSNSAATLFIRVLGTLADFRTGGLVGEVDLYSPAHTDSVTRAVTIYSWPLPRLRCM